MKIERPDDVSLGCTLLAVGGRVLDGYGEGDDLIRRADTASLLVLYDQATELRRRLVQANLELEHAAKAGYSANQAAIVTLPYVEGALRMSLPFVIGPNHYKEGPGQ